MKNLIIANSIFNIMSAVQISKLLGAEDTDLIICSETKPVVALYNTGNLRRYFNNIILVNSRYMYPTGQLKSMMQLFFPGWILRRQLNLNKLFFYDRVCAWYDDSVLYNLTRYYKIKNHRFVFNVFSDATIGYTMNRNDWMLPSKYSFALFKFIDKVLYDIPRKGIFDSLYLFSPEYYSGDIISIKAIPVPTFKERTILRQAFGGNNVKLPKFVFLGEAPNVVKDYAQLMNLFKFIIDRVGSENFAIKPHPRFNTELYGIYSKYVINTTCPLELLIDDLSDLDVIFIAGITSASIMPYIMYGQSIYLLNVLELIELVNDEYKVLGENRYRLIHTKNNNEFKIKNYTELDRAIKNFTK